MLFIRGTNNRYRVANEEDVIFEAIQIYNRCFSKGEPLTSPEKARDCIKLKLAPFEYEVFACVFLDNQHKVIACDELFRGTIDSASVYPREVVKAALKYNAAALILAHNHPSGIGEPSQADKAITDKLKAALALVDIRVLDHFIIGETVYSFAENGLL
ncbi:RadC family protein [Methylotuvimicrobium buryatense]|uniref:DNA repair protein RadC n=1 Tax=Methylotuvimicrobium buryatense TaxID=95641 RepID=A0A4P9USY4_METBY|nr:DNA repair protein RadC [Methylotuvimicrobium buryatense]QCW83670.1 DNA repair protein RadC [Methylotuvimicrobium buryatense]